MTISNPSNRVVFVGPGNGFAYDRPVFAETDIFVEILTAAGTTILPVLDGAGTFDFTVTGTFDSDQFRFPNGVTVTLNNDLPAGDIITIENRVALIQQTDYVNGGPLNAERLETDFDRLVVMAQAPASILSDVLRISPASGFTLPPLIPAASEFLRWDSAGEAIESADITPTGELGIPVAIQDGGTGAETASDARTNLGLEIGADVPAADSVRTTLTSNTNFFVDPVNGDDGNDGLTTSTEKQTLQAMLDVLHDEYDLAGFVATINFEGGATATEAVTLFGPFVGADGPDSVVIDGPDTTPDNFHINASGLGEGSGGAARPAALRMHDGAAVTIKNFSVTSTDGYGLMATRGGYIKCENWKFNDLLRAIPDNDSFEGAAFIAWEGGIIEVLGGGEIAGDMDTIFNAQHHGQLICNANDPVSGATVTFTGTLDIASTVYARNVAAVRFPDTGGASPIGGDWTFDTSGATLSYGNMRRFLVIQNGTLQFVNGDRTTTFPGNSIGEQIAGGFYYTGGDNRSKVISFTRDISVTGDQTVATGFFPETIIIMGTVGLGRIGVIGAIGSAPAGTDAGRLRFTPEDSAGDVFLGIQSSDTTTIISLEDASGNLASASVSERDEDGFTLTWSNTGSPTGTFTGIAICLP